MSELMEYSLRYHYGPLGMCLLVILPVFVAYD